MQHDKIQGTVPGQIADGDINGTVVAGQIHQLFFLVLQGKGFQDLESVVDMQFGADTNVVSLFFGGLRLHEPKPEKGYEGAIISVYSY